MILSEVNGMKKVSLMYEIIGRDKILILKLFVE